MEAKLKEKLNEAVDAAMEWHRKAGLQGPEAGLRSPQTESKALSASLVRFVRRRLRKEALWRKTQTQLANDALAQIFAKKLKPPTRPVDENQFAFPGFELPEKVRIGKSLVKLPEARMSNFLVFVEGFRARSQKDQQKAEELRRLAEKLRPFMEGDPTVGEAFVRANSQPTTLAVVPKVG